MCDWVTIQIVFDGKFFDLRIDIKIKIGSIRKKFKEKDVKFLFLMMTNLAATSLRSQE